MTTISRYMSEEMQRNFLTGKTISSFSRYQSSVTIEFEDGSKLNITLDGHSSFEPFLNVDIEEEF